MLEVSRGNGLEQFLGKVFKGVWKSVRKAGATFARVQSRLVRLAGQAARRSSGAGTFCA